jgi:very-short-patch-repair endonuclease
MSLNIKYKLIEISKVISRDLRKYSTEAEKILWEALRRKNLDGKKFYRQYVIFHDITGRETFFVSDFYCHSEKLIIELDGKYHEDQLPQDAERTKISNYLSLRVIRFNNDDVINDLKNVLEKIRNTFIKN